MRKSVKIVGALFIATLVSSFIGMRITANETVDGGKSRILPVTTITVKIDDSYMAKRTFTGRAVAGRTSMLAFEQGGTIEAIHVDLGTKVDKGASLASLDTRRLEATKAQLSADMEEVTASLSLAERTLARATKTFEGGHISAQRMDEAEANAIALRARKTKLAASLTAIDVDLAKAVIKAPFSGTITARYLDEGTVVAPGTQLLEITEDSRLEAHIGMPPKQAKAIMNGADFYLIGANRTRLESATPRALLPVITGGTRTMLVTFDLAKNGAARGELITAVVSDRIDERGVWLPIRAISADVRGLWRVFKAIPSEDGHVVGFENVQILYTRGDSVYVSGSISDGDIVISDGIDRLAFGQRISF